MSLIVFYNSLEATDFTLPAKFRNKYSLNGKITQSGHDQWASSFDLQPDPNLLNDGEYDSTGIEVFSKGDDIFFAQIFAKSKVG